MSALVPAPAPKHQDESGQHSEPADDLARRHRHQKVAGVAARLGGTIVVAVGEGTIGRAGRRALGFRRCLGTGRGFFRLAQAVSPAATAAIASTIF